RPRGEVGAPKKPVLRRIAGLLRRGGGEGSAAAAAIDGWYGVDWEAIKGGLREAAAEEGLALEIISSADLYQPQEMIEEYRRPFVTDDPSFGRVNGHGLIADILDAAKVATLRD